MQNYDKKRAIEIITDCANLYNKYLLNTNHLFICINENKKILILQSECKKENFLHLTGVKTLLYPIIFFNKCLNRKLSQNDFEIARDGTTILKLQVLPSFMKNNFSVNQVGDYDNNSLKLYTEKLFGNGKIGCMGFVKKKNGFLVPNTILNDDFRNITHNKSRIIAIFKKQINQSEYQQLVYKAKKYDFSTLNLSDQYKYLKSLL